MKLYMFEFNTFRQHSRSFVEPAIISVWKTWQNSILLHLSQKDKVIFGGDMRADSPGHSAKYGSYTMVDLTINRVVDLQLVQSNEVGGSHNMEKEGLRRSLAKMSQHGVKLDSIVTDRHPAIQKMLREEKIMQFYDVWHIEKGITKKLENASKTKECEKLQTWIKAIRNHIYWTAATSSTGPERIAKWMSLINHVQDVHTHEDPSFPNCLHPVKHTRDKHKWLSKGSPSLQKLEKIMTNKRILKDA
ncbi:uncharacterized protein LOC121202406 [Betta splendens]|uniref:Uncharacterized protein LOC121202406 n=1 Tax=Betta splendens TaxID=158456 RepID=A0A9W2XXS6_BETSP|nr:uncharacterized protein LOC121202406 [Betta splendens]